MARSAVIAAVLLSAVGFTAPPASAASTSRPTTPGAAGTTRPDPARGVVFDGLHRAPDGARCARRFQLGDACSHGPDPAPNGIDVRSRRQPSTVAEMAMGAATTAEASGGGVPCSGDGVSGYRVQAIYAHAADVGDRYGSFAGSFPQWAAQVDSVFTQSAAETGGTRHVRFVTNSDCSLSVIDVRLSTTGDDNMQNTINEIRNQGFNKSDRKYLVWVDSNVYCGIAQVYNDDSAAVSNLSNGSTSVPGEVARVDNGCWGLSGQSIEAHEVMHTLGGVQTSAPHATSYSHCWDQADRMCYDDGSGTAMRQVCAGTHSNLFDCNHDDYFHTNPSPGTYLATHWNVANSRFLDASTPTPNPTPAAPSWDSAGSPPGGMTSAPATASWGPTRFDVFARGGDNAMWHTSYNGVNWQPWESLGGVLGDDPGVASWASGRLDVFVRGTDDNLWHKWFDGAWHGWEFLGRPAGGLTSGPDAASWSAGRLDIFARGGNNALWHTWYDGSWHPWESLGGVLNGDPAAVSWAQGRLDVVVRGTDNNLWHKWFDGAWRGYENLGASSGGLNSGPAAASWSAGRLDFYARGTDNALWHKYYDGTWHTWASLGGALSSDPAAASWAEGRVDVAVRGADNALWHRVGT